MLNRIISEIENKNIAILGFGKEGMSTYRYIRKHLPNKKLTIVDRNENICSNLIVKDDNNLEFVLGDSYLNNLSIYDLIIKSPGIKIENINDIKDKVTSQIEIVLENFRDNVIGITGTKGKSTTSTLLYNVLKEQNVKCMLLGNVGNPVLDYLDDITNDTKLVIEMSSYQLELVKYSPHISVILNLYEDHLNYHGSIEKYHLSKLNIFKFQNENDFALYTSTSPNINNFINKFDYKAHILDIENEFRIVDNEIYFNNIKVYNMNDKRYLLGEHNLSNILFVIRISILLGLDLNKAVNTINNFKPLEHRMEMVGTYNNIKYYNDTIATIPEATINCLKAYTDVDTLIFGGQDRGINYDDLINYLNNSNISNFICMPETGHKLAKRLTRGKIYLVNTLEEAVLIAKKETKCACLLSPAAPSYNQFRNFEEKGKRYKELVTKE